MPTNPKSKALKKLEDDDDPFLQGATQKDDGIDPFDLEADREFVRKNLLPIGLLQLPLSFCNARTLLKATQVNKTWHEAADADKVWKQLCKAKWGSDPVKEHKAYCKNLGWKLSFFVGVCKTLLVNTPERHAIALVPYPGLDIRDMLNAIGIEKVHHFRVSSPNFCDELAAECEDVEADGDEGCWPSLANAVLCDILIEPFSTIYVESIRRKDRQKRTDSGHADDDDEPSSARENQAKAAEEQAKLAWKTKALAKMNRLPKFVWNGMQSHWTSLCPTIRTQHASSTAIKKSEPAGHPPAAARTAATPSSAMAARPTTTVTHVSGRPPSASATTGTRRTAAVHK